MKTVQINLYSLSELSAKAKENAINQHGDFLESIGNEYEDKDGQIIMDYSRPNDTEIVESIEMNDYIFFANGDIASTVTYCGTHPKAGWSEFTLNGEVYPF